MNDELETRIQTNEEAQVGMCKSMFSMRHLKDDGQIRHNDISGTAVMRVGESIKILVV